MKGFTLVELLVAIAIIGILAAIGLPQFTNALARARCGEVAVNLPKIQTAQEAYYVEVKQYKNDCTWGHGSSSQKTKGRELGVTLAASDFFKYSSFNTNEGKGHNSSAILKKNIGSAEVSGNTSKVVVNEKNEIYPEGNAATKNAFKLYLKTFINCDAPSSN